MLFKTVILLIILDKHIVSDIETVATVLILAKHIESDIEYKIFLQMFEIFIISYYFNRKTSIQLL